MAMVAPNPWREPTAVSSVTDSVPGTLFAFFMMLSIFTFSTVVFVSYQVLGLEIPSLTNYKVESIESVSFEHSSVPILRDLDQNQNVTVSLISPTIPTSPNTPGKSKKTSPLKQSVSILAGSSSDSSLPSEVKQEPGGNNTSTSDKSHIECVVS